MRDEASVGLQASAVIDGRFRLDALVRQGPSALWRGFDLMLEAPVAIRLVRDTDQTSFDRRLREAKALATLSSPHVPRVSNVGRVDGGGLGYIAIEWLEGETLAERIAREGALAPALVVSIVSQLASALGEAHARGIVHGGLTPERIILTGADRGHALVKLRGFAADRLTEDGEPFDHRADLWSLGVVTYECLTGVLPFPGHRALLGGDHDVPPHEPVSARAPVPDGIDAWFARAVKRDARERFASAGDMARSLAALVDPPPLPLPPKVPTGLLAASRPPEPRRRTWLLGIWLAGFAAVLASLWLGSAPRPVPSPGDLPEPAAAAPAKSNPPEPSSPVKGPHEALEEQLARAYDELPEGRVAYPGRLQMKQGERSTVRIRVSRSKAVTTDGVPGEVVTQSARISRLTVACLMSQPGEFELTGYVGTPTTSPLCSHADCSCLRQTVMDGESAEIAWWAKPLQSGQRKLYYKVLARLVLSAEQEEPHDVLSNEGTVDVASSWFYSSGMFIRSNWITLLPVALGGLGGAFGLLRKLMQRQPVERTAGFGRATSEAPRASWWARLRRSVRP